ncbi:hypothetical protein GCM10025874_12450 [Arenivirga flava]|uniref:Uncharacterized protein n=1 Tax=Arenivirga flava TaxID=1930060 RepID=A0AA37XBZ9_9MICO|nr:hypothetical protein GCM10025874_12450 [Arenivirga flava]
MTGSDRWGRADEGGRPSRRAGTAAGRLHSASWPVIADRWQIPWQESDDLRPSCHSWRNLATRSVRAMIVFFYLLAGLALAGVVATVCDIARDGHRRIRTRP